jgi:hypothetical protein
MTPSSPPHQPEDFYIDAPLKKRLFDYIIACWYTGAVNISHHTDDVVDWRDFALTLEHAEPEFNWRMRMCVAMATYDREQFVKSAYICMHRLRDEHAAPRIRVVGHDERKEFMESVEDRLVEYTSTCWIAARLNKDKRRGYEIVEPSDFGLEAVALGQIGHDYDGLLHSMQGIAEFAPSQYDGKTRALLRLAEQQRRMILYLKDTFQPGRRIFTVPVAPPSPVKKETPKPRIPPSLVYLTQDSAMLGLLRYDPMAHLAAPDRALSMLATPEMINRHFRKRNGGT